MGVAKATPIASVWAVPEVPLAAANAGIEEECPACFLSCTIACRVTAAIAIFTTKALAPRNRS